MAAKLSDYELLERALEAMERSVAQIRQAVHLMATRSDATAGLAELEQLLEATEDRLNIGGERSE